MKSINFEKINDILNNELSYIPIDLLDFGFGYREVVSKFKLPPEKVFNIKKKSRDFVIRLCKELTQRIPTNIILLNILVQNFV